MPPRFRLPKRFGEPHLVQHGHSGILVGYDHGEWGGALVWFTQDGSVRSKLLDDNVVAILPFDDRFIVLAGLSHPGSDRGQVVELLNDAGGFKIRRRTELGSAPRAAVMEPDGSFLIVTMDALMRLTPEFHVHRLRDTDWGMFYPVSLALDRAGKAYAGMRGIVVELVLTSDPPTETWLFPL